jgi:putative ABC transport system permease protein
VLLAAIGIYGVVAYSVLQRRKEIGVRIALGATPSQVLRLLIAENGAVVGLGLATGAVAAGGSSRLLGSMLYGINGIDLSTYVLVIFTVGLVALLASLVPALRALRVDPITALRHE